MVIITLLMFLLFFVLGALLYKIDKIANQQDCSFGEALGVGLKKAPATLLATIFYFIATIVGTVLLIIPGIILSLSLFFYHYFIILEDKTAYQSIIASHKLVWKDWWRTTGVYAVPSIILIIIFIGFGLIIGFMPANENYSIWIQIILDLLSGIYLPYLYILSYVQYHDLNLRKSGSDLEARMID